MGSTTVGPSLLCGEVADNDLSEAVFRTIARTLSTHAAEERVERNTCLQSGQLNVHVRPWRTPIVVLQPTWCLSATWAILFDGAALVAPPTAPFVSSSTARSRSVARSYAYLAQRLYTTASVREPDRPAVGGRLEAALSTAARPLKPQGFTHQSEET